MVLPLAFSGTRAIKRLLLARESGASASPKRTTGRAPCREVNPLPKMATSPPGIAAAGAIFVGLFESYAAF